MKNIMERKKVKMSEDKHLFKFICAFLGLMSIFIEGPLIPMISFVIAIGMLIYKIKCAKESPEAYQALMLDIILVIIVLVIDIVFFIMQISILGSVESQMSLFSNDSAVVDTNDSSMTLPEILDTAISLYKLGNLSQFSGDKNNSGAIKAGFSDYLENELGFTNVNVKGNKITCTFGTDEITFTVTKNDIKYKIKNN